MPLNQRYDDVMAAAPDFRLPKLTSIHGKVTQFDETYSDWIANFAAQFSDDVCLLDTTSELTLVAACVAAPSY